MIVCICKNLNGAKVAQALDAGVSEAEGVHRFHGCEHQCGSCLEEIEAMILQRSLPLAAE